MESQAVAAARKTLDALSSVYPQPRDMTIAGKAITIQPSTIRIGTQVLRMALDLWDLRRADDDDELTLVDDYPKQSAELLQAATGFDIEWLLSLDTFDKYALGVAWMEVNAAFFVLRPYQLRLRMGRTVTATMIGAGLMPSAPLSKPDTETPANTPRKRRIVISSPSTGKSGRRVVNA